MRKPLLPPQHHSYTGKITVVLEMDEILFYTFMPDEHEAYINAPLKYRINLFYCYPQK